MSATAELLRQRSQGRLELRVTASGVSVLKEEGAAKCRLPRGTAEAILINTSGGLAGGDRMEIAADVARGASLTLTTQSAERVYRTLGPAADVSVALTAGPGARLRWLPQESILFEGSALSRRLDVDVAEGASFLAVESLAFGRLEMGERVRRVALADRWRVRRQGRLLHAEATTLGPHWPASDACFGDNRAMATVLLVQAEAEAAVAAVRRLLGPQDGVSAWNGKLVARLLARDAFVLRKALIPVLGLCAGEDALPKCWTF